MVKATAKVLMGSLRSICIRAAMLHPMTSPMSTTTIAFAACPGEGTIQDTTAKAKGAARDRSPLSRCADTAEAKVLAAAAAERRAREAMRRGYARK